MIDRLHATRRSSRSRLLVLGLAGLFIAACSSDDVATDDVAGDGTTAMSDVASDDSAAASEDAGADTAAIEIVSVADAFDPATVAVSAGTEVTWTNSDGVNHTATAEDGTWDSGALASGVPFSFTPTEPGTYSYFCSIHPSMTGELIVE